MPCTHQGFEALKLCLRDRVGLGNDGNDVDPVLQRPQRHEVD